jgi:hypothetical protein
LTGEEDEETVWSCKAALYHFEKKDEKVAWRERGVGLLRLNTGPSGTSRIVMRQLGNLKLLLNARIFPELRLECTAGLPRVSFYCANFDEASSHAKDAREGGPAVDDNGDGGEEKRAGESPSGMTMYALKMGSLEKVDAFVSHVERLKRGGCIGGEGVSEDGRGMGREQAGDKSGHTAGEQGQQLRDIDADHPRQSSPGKEGPSLEQESPVAIQDGVDTAKQETEGEPAAAPTCPS